MRSKLFSGLGTALITPFVKGREVDYKTLEKLIEFQIKSKVDYLVIAGTTGEGVTLSKEELKELLIFTRDKAAGRIDIVAGCGGSNTAELIIKIEEINALKLAGYLIVTPPYNKPTQAGLIKHYTELSKAAGKNPIILYNVPGRTAGKIIPETVAELASLFSNIVAIKEASGDLAFSMAMYNVVKKVRNDFVFLSGDDSLALPLICLGYQGLISVASNEIPAMMKSFIDFALDNDFISARDIHYKLIKLMNGNFIESNPAPVKYALKKMGFGDGSVRLPLNELEDTDTIDKILKDLGIV